MRNGYPILALYRRRAQRLAGAWLLMLAGALLGMEAAAAPEISGLNPPAGAAGTEVTVTGTGFGASQGESTVTFNGTRASPTAWSETSITVPVPEGAATGAVVVTVGEEASNGASFTVTAGPFISSISPESGVPDTRVTITGVNFGASRGTSTVTFNGTAVRSYFPQWSDTSIEVAVPEGAATGPVVVTVGEEASNGVEFTVLRNLRLVCPSSISEANHTRSVIATTNRDDPPEAELTLEIEHTGTAVHETDYTLGALTFAAGQWVATARLRVVDDRIYNGERTIELTAKAEGYAEATCTVPIEDNDPPAPEISSLSPVSGSVGTEVEISGARFGASRESSTVTFSGTPASPTAWSETSITVPVPEGAETGSVVVTVGVRESNPVVFTVTAREPRIIRLDPASGPVGMEVVITGKDFGESQGRSTVTFNGTPASPAGWSDTAIAVAVPEEAETGPVVVTVGGEASNGETFTVTGRPVISSIAPDSGPPFGSVRIIGENFGESRGSSQVVFNGARAGGYVGWSSAEIEVTVPGDATTGPVAVLVGGFESNPVTFTVTPPEPEISGLEPASGEVGTTVEISGVRFGASQGASTVTFNGTPATPSSWSDTAIMVPVPEGAETGAVVVTVGGEASNGASFTVTTPPGISGLNPPAGAAGTVVTVTGTNFGASQGESTVTFSGTPASPSSWSETSITVAVPEGAATGPVVVTVGGEASNGASFTVTAGPFISSISPESGVLYTRVTISGARFGASRGESTVTFNGTAVRSYFPQWSDTSIEVAVPEGAGTGPVVVTVGEEASNGVEFTVLRNLRLVCPSSISEANHTRSVIATTNRDDPPEAELTLEIEHTGTAVHETDYTLGALTFAAGQWVATARLRVVDDRIYNGERTIELTARAEGYAEATCTVPIEDNDPPAPEISSLSPVSGPVGTEVEISGARFGASRESSTVTFSGTPASPSSWSDASITVAVPEGAGTGWR